MTSYQEEWAGERHPQYDKELRKPGPELSEKQKKDLELWDVIRFYEECMRVER